MKCTLSIILLIACLFGGVEQAQCARILAIIPTPSYSHQIPFRPLWLELLKRGHELVLITTNPMENVNSTRFKQIDIGADTYKYFRKMDFMHYRFDGFTISDFIRTDLKPLSALMGKITLAHPEVQKLYAPDSDQKFDLVMAEMAFTPSIYCLAPRFNAPLIGLSTFGLVTQNEHALGGLVLPSHEYTWEMGSDTGFNLPFWKRLKNFVTMWYTLYTLYTELIPEQQEIAERYLGPSIPSIIDVLRNTSLVFVNEAEPMIPARPKIANKISFTSFHVSTKPVPLPKDLKTFLDGATQGFIYFSLGTNALSSNIPKEILQVFIDVLAKLPYRVVWKFEEQLKHKSDNVYIAPWLSQQSILAHPNIKLFIYQGGVQSTEETIHFTVPVLGIPILGDQDYQIRRMVALGVGKCLEIVTVTREELESAIHEVISNKEYKKRMIDLKNIVNDQPYKALDYLAWWTEYVIRHKGAPHYRSNIAWQPWYRRCDVDVVIFLTIVTFIVVSQILYAIAKLIVYGIKKWRLRAASQEKKLS